MSTIINNTEKLFSPYEQQVIRNAMANAGVDTVVTEIPNDGGKDNVYDLYDNDDNYLFSIDTDADGDCIVWEKISYKTLTVQGLDTIFVTGSMEKIERIVPVLQNLGFMQIKDRPNAYEFKTGINAPIEHAFDVDPKITYMGMPVSEETAKKIADALIAEVKIKIGC